jgi:hypothetical protein
MSVDNAPSIPQMKRDIQDARIRLISRDPPGTSYDLVDMLDGKLTNYISDLRKDDPEYEKKIKYFKGLLSSGMLPNAVATFERKEHGRIKISAGLTTQPGGKKKKTRGKGIRSRRTRRVTRPRH